MTSNPNQGTWELLQEQEHLRLVACPAPSDGGCGAPVGVDCVRLHRRPVRERHEIDRTDCEAPDGCGADVGEPCAHPHGRKRRGPGCVARIREADAAFPAGAHPALPAAPEPPAPGRRLLPVDQARRDVASYVVPCGWCHRRIVHATNPRGESTPIDAEPSPDGHLLLSVDDRGPRCHPLKHGQLAAAITDGKKVHTPHRQTCPQGTRTAWYRGVRGTLPARRT
ncbi:hypothetical protein [Saccharothrix texasensis]|uniref:Uncharacterized protein n=1 Tax=Saccharothrix texasensis TaxID=103734 RepID=A0A3N1H1B2_9PSEU|nr:hypothetical protein [Saccharothrix texasensis]ROP36268.1 hypothetical protein EDD40_1533 [Saccharothrix texasensis]